MTAHNPNNERIKRQYFAYLKEAKRHGEATIDAVAKALSQFEEDTKCRDFKAFHVQQAVAFKRRLAEQRGARSGQRLSKATLHATLMHLKRFFQWLAGQPGYKSRLCYSDAEYFNLSDKDARVATARREQRAPTIEQVKHVISRMPDETELQRRNRAIVAFTLLTGARDSAIASMKLKHIDLCRQLRLSRCSRGEDQVQQDLHHVFLPGGKRDSPDSRGLGVLPAAGQGLGRRRAAVSGYADGPWSSAPV